MVYHATGVDKTIYTTFLKMIAKMCRRKLCHKNLFTKGTARYLQTGETTENANDLQICALVLITRRIRETKI